MPEPIEITFLGTGSSIPSVERSHPAILLKYGPDYILFDCGEGTQVQMEKAKISPMKVDKIFITHWHADHFAGLLPLIETLHLSKRKEPLTIVGPDASRFMDSIIELSYWGIGFETKIKDCTKNNQLVFSNDKYEITAVKTRHNVPSFGFVFKEKDHWNIDMKKANRFGLSGVNVKKIKEKGKITIKGKTVLLKDVASMTKGRKIIYSGDTLISKNLFEASRDADLLIHDGTFLEKIHRKINKNFVKSRSHATVEEVAVMAKKYNVKKLVLVHLSRRYKTNTQILREAKKYFKNVKVPKDIEKIIL